ncbi:MAG: amidohydrolase family protein [Candidatus Hodarchaeales archaeon]|jgi:predicted TIM-barrel fold metal-dependent hydrolase
MIIDVHTHVYLRGMLPDAFWQRLEQNYYRSFSSLSEDTIYKNFIEPMFNATPEDLIHDMESAGIDKSITFFLDWGLSAYGEANVSIVEANEFVAESVKKYPDRLVGFVAVDPRRPDALSIVKQGIDNGLTGIKLHPASGWYPNSSEAYEIYRFAERERFPVLTHSGGIGSGLRAKYAQPINFDEVLGDFPEMNLCLAHLGMGAGQDEIVSMMMYSRNLWTDISFYGQAQAHQSWPDFVQTIRSFMNMAPGKVMFGSDWPFFKLYVPNQKWVDQIHDLRDKPSVAEMLVNRGYNPFTVDEIERIMGKNAMKFLNKKQ